MITTTKKRSKEEIAKVWKEYSRTRSDELKNILAEQYLHIVRYQAEKMIERLPHNVQVEDLCSSGIFGLFEAIKRYDLERGVKFETYCVGRIRGAMLDELRAMDWVPRLTRARANKLQAAYHRLEKEHGRAPTDVEVARAYSADRGRTLEFVGFRWPELLSDLAEGRFERVRRGGIAGSLVEEHVVIELPPRQLSHEGLGVVAGSVGGGLHLQR